MRRWPSLPYHDWKETKDTLHMWTQIVGKVRLSLTTRVNHWWNVPLYVSPRGLTTTAIPYDGRSFDAEFDFVDHVLRIRTDDRSERLVRLEPRTVADFYGEAMASLRSLGIEPRIWTTPVEVNHTIKFEQDETHRSYDRDAVERFHAILVSTSEVLTRFRASFVGKCSPVHFFWGSFDLAVTRFSGRRAPPNPALDSINREAYSHEVSSVGWWPGDWRLEAPHFYTYATPEPEGFRAAPIRPKEAFYHETLGGFYLPHEAVAQSEDPDRKLLEFCESAYEAAATLGRWDRSNIEREIPTAAG